MAWSVSTAALQIAAGKIGAGAGGYLALTKDEVGGGRSVVSVFASYPKQVTDISDGLSQTTTALVTGIQGVNPTPTLADGASGTVTIDNRSPANPSWTCAIVAATPVSTRFPLMAPVPTFTFSVALLPSIPETKMCPIHS